MSQKNAMIKKTDLYEIGKLSSSHSPVALRAAVRSCVNRKSRKSFAIFWKRNYNPNLNYPEIT